MSRLRLMGVAAIGTLLGACQLLAQDTPGRPVPLPFRLLHTSSNCGTEAPTVQRIADLRDFNQLATSPVLGATPPLSPNFETSLVLRVSMGQQPSAGSQFGVTGVRSFPTEQRLVVDTVWNPPDPARMHAMVITRPCVILAVEVKPDSVRSVQAFDQIGEVRASALLSAAR